MEIGKTAFCDTAYVSSWPEADVFVPALKPSFTAGNGSNCLRRRLSNVTINVHG
jgi:hypothetical protein